MMLRACPCSASNSRARCKMRSSIWHASHGVVSFGRAGRRGGRDAALAHAHLRCVMSSAVRDAGPDTVVAPLQVVA